MKKIQIKNSQPINNPWPNESLIPTTIGFYSGLAYHSSADELQYFHSGTTCCFVDGRLFNSEYKKTCVALRVENCPAELWRDGEVRLVIDERDSAFVVESADELKEEYTFREIKPFPSREEEIVGTALLCGIK